MTLSALVVGIPLLVLTLLPFLLILASLWKRLERYDAGASSSYRKPKLRMVRGGKDDAKRLK